MNEEATGMRQRLQEKPRLRSSRQDVMISERLVISTQQRAPTPRRTLSSLIKSYQTDFVCSVRELLHAIWKEVDEMYSRVLGKSREQLCVASGRYLDKVHQIYITLRRQRKSPVIARCSSALIFAYKYCCVCACLLRNIQLDCGCIL